MIFEYSLHNKEVCTSFQKKTLSESSHAIIIETREVESNIFESDITECSYGNLGTIVLYTTKEQARKIAEDILKSIGDKK